ncbi:hypothetical protein PYW07_009091 [Mythimna separata]|uniref:Uncharacterized protein n=1 Tax=Mythimna separata TaxID=271217 RepID=A0AAD7YBI3_MYTSE|nr:hypothetical protein PYW07_009091 [Mythimna separata]
MCALLPNRRVKETILLTVTLAFLTHSLSINKIGHPEIVVKTRVELKPTTINAFLNDIVRISAPVIKTEAEYYLYKPNGDVMRLNISTPKLNHEKTYQDAQPIVARFVKHIKPIIQQENNYAAFTLDDLDYKVKKMEENDFLLGPLVLGDHGNWVLSVFTKDFNDEWVELFQVITISIVEYVPLSLSRVSPNSSISLELDRPPSLKVGETVLLSISWPIPDLQTCELVAPRSTFDRFYDRTRIDMRTCGFTLPNITVEDAGLWKIIAVGKIVYDGEINLNVVDNSTKVKMSVEID